MGVRLLVAEADAERDEDGGAAGGLGGGEGPAAEALAREQVTP
jgi:hypothetical protein